MSTFMEHIHRDNNTPPSFDRAALWRPAKHDSAASDNDGPAGSVDVIASGARDDTASSGPGTS